MYILGIETSCDDTAASVLSYDKKNAKILSSVVSSQDKIHTKTGGVVPEVAAREHIDNIIPVIDTALRKAGVQLNQIDTIAVTAGPGLITSLMVGVDTTKALGAALNIPVIPINHIEAHVYSPFLSSPPARGGVRGGGSFPAIALVVSGGHTDLVMVKNFLEYKKIGQTLDDAAGEAFDKIAKLLGLPYPGGPALAELAKSGKPIIEFPRPLITSKDFNFSFSGLKTSVLYYLKDHKLRTTSYKLRSNIAASAQQAIIDVLIAKTIRAGKTYKAKIILLGGGVAANKLLRKTLQREVKKHKMKLLIAPPNLCTDNAAMIAFAGYLKIRHNKLPKKKLSADANWEIQ